MQQSNIAESLIAAIVIAVGVGFLVFTLATTGTASFSNYEISARVPHADGIAAGTDVEIAGVKIGTVRGLTLDRKHFFVTLSLAIREGIKVPDNSHLSVSGSPLGASYLLISPGNSRKMVPPGGVLR